LKWSPNKNGIEIDNNLIGERTANTIINQINSSLRFMYRTEIVYLLEQEQFKCDTHSHTVSF
jgi:hypothetical protein